MPTSEIHLGDIGTVIRITLVDANDGEVVDISAATLTFYFKKPSGTVVTKTGSLYTDGTDGSTQYITEENFLDQKGVWNYEIKVEIGPNEWRSNRGCFTVYGNIS